MTTSSVHDIIVHNGPWVITTATVTSHNDEVINVVLHNDRYHEVSAASVEVQRKFWTQHHQRMGWTRSWAENVARAISVCLVDKTPSWCEDEDGWMDAAFEDRFAML